MSLMCCCRCLPLLSHSRVFRGFVSVCLLAAYPVLACALNTDTIDVSEKDGVYAIHVSARLPVPARFVRQVLTDYDHLYRISSSIIESEVLAAYEDGGALVRSKVLCCTALFCQEVERVEKVDVVDDSRIVVTIVPGYSEFRSGMAVWRLEDEGEYTLLDYQASIEPDFFIPPLLGVSMVKKHIYTEFRDAFFRLAHIAAIRYEQQWDTDYIARKNVADKSPCDGSFKAALQ